MVGIHCIRIHYISNVFEFPPGIDRGGKSRYSGRKNLAAYIYTSKKCFKEAHEKGENGWLLQEEPCETQIQAHPHPPIRTMRNTDTSPPPTPLILFTKPYIF
jgi:hypothetical protein